MSNRRAFTLIELLVVISIIALLIAILLPALASSRKVTRQIQCVTQVRGIQQALAMYQSDNKTYYPYATDGRVTSSGGTLYNHYFSSSLNAYLGLPTNNIVTGIWNKASWHCTEHDRGAYPRFGIYGHNGAMMGFLDSTGKYDPSGHFSLFNSGRTNVKESDLDSRGVKPSRMTTFMDGWIPYQYSFTSFNTMHGQVYGNYSFMTLHQAKIVTSSFTGSYPGMNNVISDGFSATVFLDGHARATKAADWPTNSTVLMSYQLLTP